MTSPVVHSDPRKGRSDGDSPVSPLRNTAPRGGHEPYAPLLGAPQRHIHPASPAEGQHARAHTSLPQDLAAREGWPTGRLQLYRLIS